MKNLCILNGRISYDRLSGLDFIKPAWEQLESLSEDLLQVNYDDDIVLDVGWYPSFSKKGEFIILIARGGDWENPLRKVCTKSLEELMSMLGTLDAGLSLDVN